MGARLKEEVLLLGPLSPSYPTCVKHYFAWPPLAHHADMTTSTQVERSVLYNEHRPRRPPLDLPNAIGASCHRARHCRTNVPAEDGSQGTSI